MPEASVPPEDSQVSGGNMPSYAQDSLNLADPCAFQANYGHDPYLAAELYGPFYPQSYMMQSPYTVPFVYPDPFLGQPVDLRTLYGPLSPYVFSPHMPDVSFPYMHMRQGIAPSSAGKGSDASANVDERENADLATTGEENTLREAYQSGPIAVPRMARAVSVPQPPIRHVHHVSPIHSTQIVHSDQAVQQSPSSQAASVSQQSQATQQEPLSQGAQVTTQETSANVSRPSVQVVVQPSQPFAPVQAQKGASTTSTPPSSVTMQSQMPTNVMQPVPNMGQLYGSGMLYPPQSSPFFANDYVAYDMDVATGGRAAGATFLGVLSIPFSLFAPLGFLFSLVGLHLANSYVNNGGSRAVGNFARFFNVIGLILTIAVTAIVALYVGYSAGQEGFLIFGQDPIAFINNSEPMRFLFEQWNKLKEIVPAFTF